MLLPIVTIVKLLLQGWSLGVSKAPLSDDIIGIIQLSNQLLISPNGLPFKDNENGQYMGVWLFDIAIHRTTQYNTSHREQLLDIHVLCYVTSTIAEGKENGFIYASTSSGTPPFTYKWQNDATTNAISGVAVG